MYQEERLIEIIKLLENRKALSNQEIMEYFHISRDTARRDIVKLVETGAAVRTHGGITLHDYRLDILSYTERIAENYQDKKKVANVVSSYLVENQFCFFDVSTTIALLCEKGLKSTKVYTNSLHNLSILQGKTDDIHLLGGKLNEKTLSSRGKNGGI